MRWSLGVLVAAVAAAAQASVVVPLDAVPTGSGDRPRWRDVAETPYAVAYDSDYGADTVYVFGEQEHTRDNVRPLPGDDPQAARWPRENRA